MIKNLKGYTEHVGSNIWYWKYNPHIYYMKKSFKFSGFNMAAGYNAVLTIHGITPEFKKHTISITDYETAYNADMHMNVNWPSFITDAYNQAKQNNAKDFQIGWDIPSKKYRVYYETRTSNFYNWEVVIPKVDVGWDVLNGKREGDATPYFESTDKFFGGLTYDPAYGHPNLPGYDSRVSYETWGLPDNLWTSRQVTMGNDPITYTDANDNEVTYNGGKHFAFGFGGISSKNIPVALSRLLNAELPGILSETGEHPAFKLSNNKNDPKRTKFYEWVPIGISTYNVTLEFSNGEFISHDFIL